LKGQRIERKALFEPACLGIFWHPAERSPSSGGLVNRVLCLSTHNRGNIGRAARNGEGSGMYLSDGPVAAPLRQASARTSEPKSITNLSREIRIGGGNVFHHIERVHSPEQAVTVLIGSQQRIAYESQGFFRIRQVGRTIHGLTDPDDHGMS
jgi:hypothetical protein